MLTYTFEEINKLVDIFTTAQVNNILKERQKLLWTLVPRPTLLTINYYASREGLGTRLDTVHTYIHTYMVSVV